MESVSHTLEGNTTPETTKMQIQIENLNTDSFTFGMLKESDKIRSLIKNLGVESINEVILNKLFLHETDDDESNDIFKHYVCHLSIEAQSMFFNSLFKFSKTYQNVNFLCIILEYIDKTALTHETSGLRTKDFWVFLTDLLETCKDFLESQKIIFVLETCIDLFMNAGLDLPFPSTGNGETAWNAFLASVQVCNDGKKVLFKPSLELLEYILPLHLFLQYWAFKLLMNRATNDLKCLIINFFLKQPINANCLQNVLEIILPAIDKHECNNEECPAIKELHNFCDTLNVEQFMVILDAILKFSWNSKAIECVVKNVLVDSKKNLIDFGYFYRFEALLNAVEEDKNYWPDDAAKAVIQFFGDSENFDTLCQIKRSSIRCYQFSLSHSEDFKITAMRKLLDLSNENSDDVNEIRMYFSFLQDRETYGDMIKNHQLSIHVRLLIYRRLFTIAGYYYAERELDREKTITDFYEYLVKHLNEETYLDYRELMVEFLELIDRVMSFAYPKKACLEILNIMRNPDLYTKYQIYCAAGILTRSDYRFEGYLLTNVQEYYNEIAQKWKNIILETDDDNICKEGLYFVLKKGQLNTKDYNEMIEKLLEKHLCNDISEEIYKNYLNVDLINYTFKRLKDIIEHNPKKCEMFSKLFCEAVFSEKYVNSDQFNLKNEKVMFCFSNSKNLQYSMYELNWNWCNHEGDIECRRKIIDIINEIYLNGLSTVETKVYCLHVLMRAVQRYSYDKGRPPFYFPNFREDIKMVMNKFKEKYAANLKNDINKLRIVQALFLLVPYVMRDFNKFKNVNKLVNIHKKLRNSLKRIAVGILVKESSSNNKAVGQICQYMYTLLCEHDVTFEEIKRITEKVKEDSNLARSFMPVLYHVIPFCKLSENETEEIFSTLFVLFETSDGQLKLYVQILLQHLYNLSINKKFKNIEKYKSRFEQIDLDIEGNEKQIAEVLDVDYLFLKVLDPVRDHSLETVLYTIPKLNQVESSEWKDVMKYGLIWYAACSTKSNDENETFKKSVDQFLEAQIY